MTFIEDLLISEIENRMINKFTSLSICIPTYNRPEKIRSTIIKLAGIKQIDFVKILIVDNCSPVSVLEIYNNLGIKLKNIRIVRNSTNIGIAANIMRCIEYAETDWIWLLSDDDIAFENAVEIISNDIHQVELLHTNTVLLKYSSKLASDSSDVGTINKAIYIKTIEELFVFLTQNNFFPSFLFMSSEIINRNIFLRYYI
jgi:glycosyltransferase involved in cell wall biosynthesis